MTFARPLFLLLLVAAATTISMAADDPSKSQASVGSLQNQVGDSAPFGAPAQDFESSSGLFFLKTRPRLNLNPPTVPPRFAILNDDLCYTMRTYIMARADKNSDVTRMVRATRCLPAWKLEFKTASEPEIRPTDHEPVTR